MKTITTYSIDELRESFPDAYARVLKDEASCVYARGCAWGDEISDSLHAVLKAFGRNGRTGPSDYVYDDETGEERLFTLADAWAIIRDEGYTESEYLPNDHHKDGRRHFPGVCGFTGYCADDDILESILHDLEDGCTLGEALRNAGDTAERIAQREMEYEASEESIVEGFDDSRQFTEDGTEV
jgi:hypothetical protein